MHSVCRKKGICTLSDIVKGYRRLIILCHITPCKAFLAVFPRIRVGIGVQQGLFYLEQVLRAYREAAQTKVQVLRRIGGVATARPQMVTGTWCALAASITMAISFFMAGLAGR